jgi:hypothetical protein
MELVVKKIKENKNIFGELSGEKLDEFSKNIENHIIRKIYKYVYPPNKSEIDLQIQNDTRTLGWIQPEHLEIKKLYVNQLKSAEKYISKMNEAKSVFDKLECIQNAFVIMNNTIKFISGKNENAGQDHFDCKGLAGISVIQAIASKAEFCSDDTAQNSRTGDSAKKLCRQIADKIREAHPAGKQNADRYRRIDMAAGHIADGIRHRDDYKAKGQRRKNIGRIRFRAAACNSRNPAGCEDQNKCPDKFRNHLPDTFHNISSSQFSNTLSRRGLL